MNLILKIKLFTTCLLFLISLNVSSGENKNFDEKDLIEACKGDDTSKWDDCFGEELINEGSEDLDQYVTSSWSKGFYKDGKKNGFFNEGLWIRRHDISSDGYQEKGYYLNGVRQGLWGYCYLRQVSYTYFMIGSYNENGQKDGPWGTFNTYDQDFKDKDGNYSSFFETGCHVETALLHLNKEDPCSKKKSSNGGDNLFTDITYYKDGKRSGTGGICNHPMLDTTGEYKDTWYFKEWVELLENYEN